MDDATPAGEPGQSANSRGSRRTLMVGCAALAVYLAGLGCMFLGDHGADETRPVTVAEQR
jgi:hypothetical protein